MLKCLTVKNHGLKVAETNANSPRKAPFRLKTHYFQIFYQFTRSPHLYKKKARKSSSWTISSGKKGVEAILVKKPGKMRYFKKEAKTKDKKRRFHTLSHIYTQEDSFGKNKDTFPPTPMFPLQHFLARGQGILGLFNKSRNLV